MDTVDESEDTSKGGCIGSGPTERGGIVGQLSNVGVSENTDCIPSVEFESSKSALRTGYI